MASAQIANYIPNTIPPPPVDFLEAPLASLHDLDESDDDQELLSTVTTEDSRYTLYQEEIGYKTPKDHREMELYMAEILGEREVSNRISYCEPHPRKASSVSFVKGPECYSSMLINYLSLKGSQNEEQQKPREQSNRSSETIEYKFTHRLKKHERVLGIGMEFPEPPSVEPRSPHTSTNPSRSSHTSRGIIASYIPPCSDEDDTPSPPSRKSSLSHMISALSLSKISKMRKKSIPQPITIEHVTYDASRANMRWIANSEDPEAAIQAWVPRVIRKYDAEYAYRQSEMSEAQYSPTKLSPQGSSNYTHAQTTGTSSSSRDAKGPELRIFARQRSAIDIRPPNPPFSRSVLQRHSSDQLQTEFSSRKNSSSSTSHTLQGNRRDDHRFWFRQITEDDITFPTHDGMEVSTNTVFTRPGWFKRGESKGDTYHKTQSVELRRISKLTDWLPSRQQKSSSENGTPRTSSSSDSNIREQRQRGSDARSESRWSAYSEGEPRHSWSLPSLWGSKKRNSFEGGGRKMVATLSQSEALQKPTKPKSTGGVVLKRSRVCKASSETGLPTSRSNTESIPHVGPVTYIEPHPGERIATPPAPRLRRVLKHQYVSKLQEEKKEGKKEGKRREEFKRPTTNYEESCIWI